MAELEGRDGWRRGGWIQTASGGRFYPLEPKVEDVQLSDIAHALGRICRFGGHVLDFYSVAQHSVGVSVALSAEGHPRAVALAGLLHDAAEAYLGDVVRPLKRELFVWEDVAGEGGDSFSQLRFGQVEERVLRCIFQRLSVGWPDEATWLDVKEQDERALMTERRDLLPAPPVPWVQDERGVKPWDHPIDALAPRHATTAFLDRARDLGLVIG